MRIKPSQKTKLLWKSEIVKTKLKTRSCNLTSEKKSINSQDNNIEINQKKKKKKLIIKRIMILIKKESQ